MPVTQEILNLKFNNWSDSTSRHTSFVHNTTISERIIVNYPSARFTGNSFIELYDNEQDWLLGSTLNTQPIKNRNWFPTNSDNTFTIDCWVYPLTSSSRYLPIISSFKSKWGNKAQYDLGWCFQLDAVTGKLQLISYLFGNCTNRVLESFGSIKFNQWNHVALMSWKISDVSSLKLLYIDGHPDGMYNISDSVMRSNQTGTLLTSKFPISNTISHESQYGISGINETSPVYIGLGPRTRFTHPEINDVFYFKSELGLGFNGYISRFRVCLGTRYSEEGTIFDPYSQYDEIITTTTVTTSTTETTTTTQGEWGEIPFNVENNDLLCLKLRNNINDLSKRHHIKSIGNTVFSMTDLGCKSLNFNGSNHLRVVLNEKDFSLGSTLSINPFDELLPVCQNNNKFSLEFWFNPQPVNNTYLGICGSYSNYFFPTDIEDNVNFGTIQNERDFQVGWSILYNSVTGKLLIVSYAFGSLVSQVESTLTIPSNEWTHIALMAEPDGTIAKKYLFINGVPDALNPYKNPEVRWTNGIHRASVNSLVDSYSCLFIGQSIDINQTDNLKRLDYRYSVPFTGNLSSFRISSALRYPTNGDSFNPPSIPRTTSSSSTSTITTATTTTETTTTIPPEGFVRVGGNLIVSSSQLDGKPQYVDDNDISTAWQPITSTDAWIGLECDDSTK